MRPRKRESVDPRLVKILETLGKRITPHELVSLGTAGVVAMCQYQVGRETGDPMYFHKEMLKRQGEMMVQFTGVAGQSLKGILGLPSDYPLTTAGMVQETSDMIKQKMQGDDGKKEGADRPAWKGSVRGFLKRIGATKEYKTV